MRPQIPGPRSCLLAPHEVQGPRPGPPASQLHPASRWCLLSHPHSPCGALAPSSTSPPSSSPPAGARFPPPCPIGVSGLHRYSSPPLALSFMTDRYHSTFTCEMPKQGSFGSPLYPSAWPPSPSYRAPQPSHLCHGDEQKLFREVGRRQRRKV